MAATMTDSGELTYVSFGIEKVESTPDGDLMVYGKATDGSVDHDQQIVDPGFSSKAISDWLATGGNIRVQHNPQRDPAGIGVEATTDASGATWVKALVVEPIAKKLVSKGALRAYSVGIANPTIERDITGKARGGIIKAGKIVEISLVDRPANASCGIQLVKSVGDHSEYVGEVFGDREVISKAIGDEGFTGKTYQDSGDVSSFDPMSIDFTPNDLMRIMQEKMAKKYAERNAGYDPFRYSTLEKRNFDPGVGGGVDRDKLPESDFAGPHRSFPIVNQSDVGDALGLVGHADDPAAVRARIHAIARRKGFSVPDDKDDAEKNVNLIGMPGGGVPAAPASVPDVVKDPDGVGGEGGGSDPTPGKKIPKPQDMDSDGDFDAPPGKAAKAAAPPKKAKKPKGGKKMPPWLNKPADGDADDSSKSLVAGDAEKCDMDPKTASGAEEPADMDPAPLGMLQESPAKPHMKGEGLTEQAYMRFKTIGIDTELGVLHDLTCPAFHPEDVSKVFPMADFTTVIDEQVWQRKALAAATGGKIQDAMDAQAAWAAAVTLKGADQAMLADFRVDAYKAFRDANPGPTSFPTPCELSPKKFNRPCITDGHSANSQGYGSPNSGPAVASGPVTGGQFDRPPLSSGHQSPSPSFMKGGFEYPKETGVPTQIRYAEIEKDKARRALSMMHDHLNHMFPSSCPMLDQDAYRQEDGHNVALPVGIGKTEVATDTGEVLGDVYKYIAKLEKKVRAGQITEDEARSRLSKRTARKYAEDLKRQVDKGITSIDEVRKALGLPETESPFASGGLVTKNVTPEPEPVNKGMTPDVMKSMMTEILREQMAPLQEKISAQEDVISQYQREMNEMVAKHQEELDVHRQRFEALADTSDPNSAPMRGLAFNPMPARTAAPAGIVQQAEVSKSVQGMMMRQLERTWRTSENPAEREAAYNALLKYQGKTSD